MSGTCQLIFDTGKWTLTIKRLSLIIKINETLSLKNGQNSRERNVRFSSVAH